MPVVTAGLHISPAQQTRISRPQLTVHLQLSFHFNQYQTDPAILCQIPLPRNMCPHQQTSQIDLDTPTSSLVQFQQLRVITDSCLLARPLLNSGSSYRLFI